MRLVLLIALLIVADGGYFFWKSQSVMSPIARASEPLTRYAVLTRCAGLQDGLNDALKARVASSLERIGHKSLAEIYLMAAHPDKGVNVALTRVNYDKDIVADQNANRDVYAAHFDDYLDETGSNSAQLIASNIATCPDYKSFKQ